MSELGKRKPEAKTEVEVVEAGDKKAKVEVKSRLLKDRFPELYKQIHPTLNKHINLEKLTYGSEKEIFWLCDAPCGHHIWPSTPNSRTSQGSGCPFCVWTHKRVCRCSSFGTLYPELVKEIDFEKSPIDVYAIAPHAAIEVHWLCSISKCSHHAWTTTIHARTSNDRNCPFCSNQKVCPCNSLGKLFPEICSEIDRENSPIDEFSTAPHSSQVVHWSCKESKCSHHKWTSRIADRTSKLGGCPFCSGRRTCHCSSTGTLYSHLLEQLDTSKIEIDLFTISPGSNIELPWKCTKSTCSHHRWTVSLIKRTYYGSGCPFCTKDGGRVCPCDSFAKLFPHLLKELDLENCDEEIDPEWLAPHSDKRLAWKCSACDHRWRTMVNARTGNSMSGCPKCWKSRMEKQCEQILTKLGKEFIDQKKFDDCKDKRLLPFDFFIDSLSIIIEVDGQQHFESVTFGGGEWTDLEAQQRRDKIKNEWCLENGYHLLRISYSEAKNMETIIVNFLAKVDVATTTLQEFIGEEYKELK